MSNIPLTEQQLTAIAARAQAATPGPWLPYTVHGPTFYANVAGPYLRGVGDLDFGVGEQAEADKEFVKHAQQDVTALVAAVRRLQQQRKCLIGQLAKRDAETGRGDKALREFLASETAASLEAQPVPLRWGLDDVMWGDDDTTTVMLSGPGGEPYWLELDPERTAALRECLAGPDADEETHVVADDSDDPEHADDCPGCAATPAP